MTLNQNKNITILQVSPNCREVAFAARKSFLELILRSFVLPWNISAPALEQGALRRAGRSQDLLVLRCCHKHIRASRARQTPQQQRVVLVLAPIPSCQPCKRSSRTRTESQAQQQQAQERQGVGRELLTARAGTLPLVTHLPWSLASRNAAPGHAFLIPQGLCI